MGEDGAVVSAPEDRSKRKFVSSPPPKAREYLIISNRGGKGVEKVEMHLLPSMGYRTREDAERELWRFKKVNSNLKVELR